MKAVLFDLGRVLIGYDHVQTLASLAALAHMDVAEMRARFELIRPELELGQIESDALLAWFQELAGREIGFEAFYAAFTSGIHRDEEALAYAAALEANPELLVAAVSNTNQTHIRWLDEWLPELRDFDLVMFSSEIGLSKPDPAVFRLALELLDLRPDQVILVDDVAENVRAAASLGIAGIVHESWQETRPRLEAWLLA